MEKLLLSKINDLIDVLSLVKVLKSAKIDVSKEVISERFAKDLCDECGYDSKLTANCKRHTKGETGTKPIIAGKIVIQTLSPKENALQAPSSANRRRWYHFL